jgi:hypothetical protein
VFVVQGAIFVVCVLLFRRGIIGELAHTTACRRGNHLCRTRGLHRGRLTVRPPKRHWGERAGISRLWPEKLGRTVTNDCFFSDAIQGSFPRVWALICPRDWGDC